MLAAAAPGLLCGPPQQTHNVQAVSTLSFSKSSLLSPRFLQSGAASSASCFTESNRGRSLRRRGVVVCKSTDERTPPTAETNPLVRLAWYGSEAFGKVVAGFRPSKPTDGLSATEEESLTENGPVERKDALELLRADLDRSYFVTGWFFILVIQFEYQ